MLSHSNLCSNSSMAHSFCFTTSVIKKKEKKEICATSQRSEILTVEFVCLPTVKICQSSVESKSALHRECLDWLSPHAVRILPWHQRARGKWGLETEKLHLQSHKAGRWGRVYLELLMQETTAKVRSSASQTTHQEACQSVVQYMYACACVKFENQQF